MPRNAKVRESQGKSVVDLTIHGQLRACEVKEIRGRQRVVVVLDDRWAVEWTENGKSIARTVRGDKRLATAALARYEEQAARRRHGLPDPVGEAKARALPIVEVVSNYLEVLRATDTSKGYLEHTRARLFAMIEGCTWQTWPDISSDSLIRFLGHLRDNRNLSLSTLNGYIRTAKGFSNWYAERVRERSPLRGLKPYPEQKDRRRSRRILTEDEFDRLLAAARSAPRRFNSIINGKDRAILYQVAAYSGLRASELARLAASSLRLDDDPPAIVVYGKGKREERTAIPTHLADVLRKWLGSRKPGARLFPGNWAAHRHQCGWLARDCRRAGLGAGVLFHGLRRRYVTQLIRAGNEPDVVRRMARHKDVKTTLDYYAELTPADLKRAAESLKPPRAG